MWVKGEYFDDLAAVEAVARGTLDRAAQPSPFDRIGWFKLLWAHDPPGLAPLVVRTRTEGADGWLFLARRAGGRAQALANWYTLAFAPIWSGAPDEVLRRRLLRAMAKRLRDARLGIASLTIEPIAADDAGELAAAFRHAGWAVETGASTANWRLDVAGRSFDEYWASRPGALRSTVARKEPLDIAIFDRFDPRAWEAYETIYGASWKPAEGSPAMLRAFAEAEGAAETLRLGIASHAGQPVAAQLWTVEHGAAIIHKLAHVEDARAQSPGTQLTAAMMRRAIDVDGVQSVDFGTGDDAYKADWMEQRRMLRRVDLFNLANPRAWVPATRATVAGLVRRRALD